MRFKNIRVKRHSLRRLLSSSLIITSLFAVMFFVCFRTQKSDAWTENLVGTYIQGEPKFHKWVDGGSDAHYGDWESIHYQEGPNGGQVVILSEGVQTYWAKTNGNEWLTFKSDQANHTDWGFIENSWVWVGKGNNSVYYFTKASGYLAKNTVVFATNALANATNDMKNRSWYYFDNYGALTYGWIYLNGLGGGHWYNFNNSRVDQTYPSTYGNAANNHGKAVNARFVANTNINAGTDLSVNEYGSSNRYLYYVDDKYVTPTYQYENVDGTFSAAVNGTKQKIEYYQSTSYVIAGSVTITPPAKAIDSKANYVTPAAVTVNDSMTSYDNVITAEIPVDPTQNFKYYRPKYTIAFNGNGATSGSTASISNVKYGQKVSLTNNGFSKVHRVYYNYNGGEGIAYNDATFGFAGWATSSNGEVAFANNSEVSNLSSTDGATVTLYAKWNNGGVTLPSASRNGYTFDGWYSSNTYTTKVGNAGDIYIPGSNGVNLYAKWTPITYTISYTLNNGNAIGNPTTYTIETNTININNPTRTGYNFTGWTGVGISGQSTTVQIPKGSTGNRSYVACYTAQTNVNYSVLHYVMNMNGTSYKFQEVINYSNGVSDESINLDNLANNYEGFTYSHAAESFSGQHTNMGTIIPNGTAQFFLFYTRNKSTVTLNKTKGIRLVSGSGQYYYSTGLVVNCAVEDGYTFRNWTGSYISNSKEFSLTVLDDDITLTANADPITYNITYKILDTSNREITCDVSSLPSTYTVEDNITINTPLVKSGYEFLGWESKTSPSSSVSIHEGTTGDMEIVAYFNPLGNIHYTVNHYKQKIGSDASVHNSSNYELADSEDLVGMVDTPVTPDRKDYTGFTKPNSITVASIDSQGTTVIDYYYTRNHYDLTFVTQGPTSVQDSYSTKSLWYGEELGTLDFDPREDEIFDGWYYDVNYTRKASASDLKEAKETFLYDRWITCDNIDPQTYTSEQITPQVVLKDNKSLTVDQKDYNITYARNIDAGWGEVHISSKNGGVGTIVQEFVINKKVLTLDDVLLQNFDNVDNLIIKGFDGNVNVLASLKLGKTYGRDLIKFDYSSASYSRALADNHNKIDVIVSGISLKDEFKDNYSLNGDTKTFYSYGMIKDLDKPYVTKIEILNGTEFYIGQVINFKLTTNEKIKANNSFVIMQFGELCKIQSSDVLDNEILFNYEVKTTTDFLNFKPQITLQTSGNVTDLNDNILELSVGVDPYTYLNEINVYAEGFNIPCLKVPNTETTAENEIEFIYDFTSIDIPNEELDKIVSLIKVFNNDKEITEDVIITKDEVENKFYVKIDTASFNKKTVNLISTKLEKYLIRNSNQLFNEESKAEIYYPSKTIEPEPQPEPKPEPNRTVTSTITVQTVNPDTLAKKYMNGYNDNTFKPNNFISRAEVCAILSRISTDFDSNKDYSKNKDKFVDMKSSKNWYDNYVGFAVNKKIVDGYTDGTFKPNSKMTRAEFTKVICKMYNLKTKGTSKAFNDIEGKWYSNYAKIVSSNGYITGYEDGSFKGSSNITRAEAAVIINRTLGVDVSKITIDNTLKDKIKYLYTDIKETDWFYKDVLCSSVKLN